MTDTATTYSLDDYFQTTAIGSVERAIGNNLYGINHRQIAALVPSNKDLYGLTFFVRPQLNLQGNNIRNLRHFYPLLSKNEFSMQRIIRCLLDPRLMYGYTEGKNKINCSVVDNESAFFSILTNNLVSMSGWPDMTSPTFSSKEGIYKEIYSQVDGIVDNYEMFTIDATFRNTRGDPILFLFYIWLRYQSAVFTGTLVPYPDFIVDNRIDYNTRIYRLVLDPSRRFVRKIAATGVSFPISDPLGQAFDFNSERPYNDQSKEITIRFQCLGAQYMDDILILEFNRTVAIFNPAMKDNGRNQFMQKIPENLLLYFNNRGYPYINPQNYELEWYVNKNFFNSRITGLQQTQLITI